MHGIKIAIQLKSLRLPFQRALVAARELGASAVEIDARGDLKPQEISQTGMRQIRKLLEDLELKVCAVGFQTRRGYNVPQDLEQRVEATRQAMQFARSLGASWVVNQVGRIPAESKGQTWDMLVQVLTDLGAHAQRAGAMLAAETGTESGADMRRLLDALPPGSMGVTLDPGNLIINGFSCLDAVRALGADIQHVHAKDGVQDLAQGRGVEVPLGRGAADFHALLGALEEHDYRGYFCIERERAADPLLEVGQAVQYLKSM